MSGAAPRVATTGVVVFVVSDALTFVALLGGALALRSEGRDWSAGGIGSFEQLAILSALLFGASACVALGRRARSLLAVAAVLAALFVAGELREWRALSAAGHGPSADLHHASLFVVTGLHALHVLGGLVAVGWLAARRRSEAALRGVAYYFAALDLAWVGIVATLYAT